MRIGSALLVCGALTLGACGSSRDVRSTESFSIEASERLPPVDEAAATTTSPVDRPTTLPGTRPVDLGSYVLLASDLPGWDVGRPVDVPAETTWEALDCTAMTVAWDATGMAGARSRGTNGGASFRNTAVEFATAEAASEVLDAVDRVSSECASFETATGSFWSEPIVMPSSTLRTSGLAVGNVSSPNWTLAYWQVDMTVVILEIEGDEMWAYLEPLTATLSARLDGTPTPIANLPTTTIATTTPDVDLPPQDLPVIVPSTRPTNELPTTATTATTTTEPRDDTFPPTDEDWTEHRLAHLAPTPEEIGAGWEYDHGRRTQAEPADPDDAIEGCDAPVPPTLDGYEVDYRNQESQTEASIMVGNGKAAESQIWIDAFRAVAACDPEPLHYTGEFDLVEGEIEGASDSVVIAGEVEYDFDAKYFQVIGAARVDEILVVAFIAATVTDENTANTAITQVRDMLASMLEAR